jgi:hypothetical protein
LSRRAWGGIEFYRNLSLKERVDFSFRSVELATNNLIGIKLGWNVSIDFRREFGGATNIVPFELIDNPLTNVAEELFVGDGISIFENEKRVDSGESLHLRMARVQNFLNGVTIREIKSITLHIDSGFEEEILIKKGISEFKDEIVRMFESNKNLTPTVKFLLSNSL